MNIYLLKLREDLGGYDCQDGVVVRAKNEVRARSVAATSHGDEGGGVWTAPADSSCEIVAMDVPGDEGMILRDFHAG